MGGRVCGAFATSFVIFLLLPLFGDLALNQVAASKIHEYRAFKMTPPKAINPNSAGPRPFDGTIPAPKTLHNENVTLRQVLNTAVRLGWFDNLPALSAPYKRSDKVSHRRWCSPVEYQQLCSVSRPLGIGVRTNPERPDTIERVNR